MEKELSLQARKNYEISFLVRNENEGEEIVKVLKDYKADITANGGISKIKLAYPIEKENFAFFDYLHFSANPEEIKKIDSAMKLNSKVLRFLIISSPITKPAIQAVVRKPLSSRLIVSKPEIKKEPQAVLTNEALEKKLEEILK